MSGSLSRRERRKLVRLARHDVGGEPVLAYRYGLKLLMKRVSARGARHDYLMSEMNTAGNDAGLKRLASQ